ncbi:MAG TPA: ABC transporter substrate-binding protein [Hyphomicrobiales bacterium]|nr:ABC transporter substrate-binding protein [Hyphomicrobiales bacterium]
MLKLLGTVFGFALFAGPLMAEPITPDIVRALAPSGQLRAAINFGNPVLAQKDAATGEPRGVTADLARELAKRLGVAVTFIGYDTALKVFEAAKSNAWDIAFLAIDPVRAADMDFTAPYVIIEGTYAVPEGSPFHSAAELDRPGVRIAVGRGSAYDLYLTRTLKHAELVRGEGSDGAFQLFLFSAKKVDAVGGVRQPLVAFAASQPGIRVLSDRFMAIEQAMATPKGRDAGTRYLKAFVEEMKESGFVAKALAASGQAEATVAPPAPLR